jgi:hypothetical protein
VKRTAMESKFNSINTKRIIALIWAKTHFENFSNLSMLKTPHMPFI